MSMTLLSESAVGHNKIAVQSPENSSAVDSESAVFSERRQEEIAKAAFLTLEDVAHGRLLDAASKLRLIPGLARLASLVERLGALKGAESLASESSGISLLLSKRPSFIWSLGQCEDARNDVRSRFPIFETFKPASESSMGLSINVTNGERTQLRHDFPGGQQASVFVHYLVKTNFEGVSEPFVAIRWLHDGANEEVIVRFRSSSVVLGQSIEVPVPSGDAFIHVSVGRRAGKDIVLVNGLPAFFRDATTPSPTGVTLDVIGAHALPSKVEIPLLIVDQKEAPFFADDEIKLWFQLMVETFSIKGQLDRLGRLLYAFAGLDNPLSYDSYRLALSSNLKESLAYRDFLTDSLIEMLPKELRQKALSELDGKEPPEALLIEDMAVSIASNPSLHASFGRLMGGGHQKITLLDGISFRAYAGDIVGIIGKNGAGKTTFLKTLVSAMPLSRGRIFVDGRPILLRPGAGMQGDLTGRENILKTGLYMGFLPGELNELMDEIIEFAELEDHIDRPFRYYSDGMRARLIFSLATAIPRDILLLDELLSAGDMGFQRKAMKRLDDFIARAKLVFVVQHTFDFVLSRCTKCLLLDHGKPVYFGDPAIATELYRESL
jgi:ABC-type polysaccharide/polyol phosphate transport system ATPase subunit